MRCPLTLFRAREAVLRREMDIGRGGSAVAPFAIELEPPYRPFQHPSGRKTGERQESHPRPRRTEPATDLCFVRVRLSAEDSYTAEIGEQLILAVGGRNLIAFEVVGTNSKVYIQLVCARAEAPFLIAQLRSLFPHAQVFEAEDLTVVRSRPSLFAKNYRLRDSHLFQLKSEGRTEPLATLTAVLSHVDNGHLGLLQLLFQPVSHPWRENILTLSTDPWDPSKSSYTDLPDLPRRARAKVERPLFAVSLRLAATSPETLRSLESGFLPQYESIENGFISAGPMYPPEAIAGRLARSTGMILNVRELAAIAHLPHPHSVTTLELAAKTAPAPEIARLDILIPLGTNSHAGEETVVGIPEDRLVRHLSILGGTGMGKTNLMKYGFAHLLEDGYGMAVIDPKGELAQGILDLVPRHRIGDVIWFDPTDRDYPPSLNILQSSGEVAPEDLAAELMIGLKRLMRDSLRLGQRTETVLRNALMTLLSSEGEKTLNDVRTFLEDEVYRNSVLETVRGQELRSYWQRRRLSRNVVEPVITRLSAFLDRPSIRNIVGVPNKIDLQKAMAENKIFIANLHKGVLRDSAYVLGSFLLSRLQLLAMARPLDDRPVYPVLVDEFHEFAGHGMDTDSLVTFLSETRSFNVPLVASTQYLGRINRNVVQAMLGNLGTQVCMNMGPDDAQILQRQLGEFDAADLLNLDIGEAIVRMGRARDSFNLKIPLVKESRSLREEIIARSKELYCRTKDKAERILSRETDERGPKELDRLWVVNPEGLAYVGSHAQQAPSVGPEPERLAEAADGSKSGEVSQTVGDRKSPYRKDLITYLERVAETPFMPILDRDHELGLSRYKGNKLRAELADAGLVKPHKVNTGRRSGQKVLLEVTHAGYLLLSSFGVRAKRPRGRGGFAHKYYSHALKHYAEQRWAGCVATVEDASYGRPADVTVKVPQADSGGQERLIAFEMFVTGEEKELTGIAKDADIYDRVIVCAVSQSELEALMRRAHRSLGEELLRKVDFGLVSEYLAPEPSGHYSTESEQVSERHSESSKTASEFEDQVLIPKSVLEKNGPKSEPEPERRNRSRTRPGRRPKEPLIKQVEQAYSHLHDLDWLEKSRLAQLPEVQERVDSKHPMPEAQTLRRLLMAAAQQIVQVLSDVPDKAEVRTFLEMYLDGKNVTEIARELGKTREWVSKAYRKEAWTLAGTQFIKLISADNPTINI